MKLKKRLGRLKKTKVKAGHYIYAGYHVKREKWQPRGIGKRYNKTYMVWNIKDLQYIKWSKRRFSTLEAALIHLDLIRVSLYSHCIEIEEERGLTPPGA